MKYDVAIIGGGLAGLSLAIDLRKRGYTILVIEKGNYPRQKVCGEYISMESHNYLKTICPSINNFNLPFITNFRLTSTGNSNFYTSLDLGGFGISRYVLEDLLYKEAKKIGVIISINTKALAVDFNIENKNSFINTSEEIYNATIVCNATGRKSNFEAKENNVPKNKTNYVGVKYHIQLSRDSKQIEIHNFNGGYCGISNIEDDKVCLCYIVNSEKLKSVNNSIAELEKKYLFKNKNLKTIFSQADFITKVPITISGINFLIKAPVINNVFYLGDSAGTIAPITGNGMSICLRSASILATKIDEYFSKTITKQQLIDDYKLFWKQEFSTRIKLSRYFQKLSEFPILTNVTIGVFNLFPWLAKKVIKQTHGKPF